MRLAALATVACVLAISARVTIDLRTWHDTPLASPSASIRTTEINARMYDGAASWLADCARPGEPVLVAPDMALLYFLADRPNPTPYDLLIPGDIDEDVVLARSIDVRCAVFRPRFFWQFGQFPDWFPKTAAMLEAEFTVADRLRVGSQEWRLLRRRR